MLLVGIAWAGFFLLGALKLAMTARSSESVLVVDEAGIRSPANDVSVLWGGRVKIHIDDLSMPPDELVAAVEERFASARTSAAGASPRTPGSPPRSLLT